MQKNVCPCHQSSVGTITFQCQKSVSSDAYLLQADNHNYFSGITKAGKESIITAKQTLMSTVSSG